MTVAVNWLQSELDLGVKLNTALQTNEPSRFRFLLAALSPHVTDQPFKQKNTTAEKTWVPPFQVGVQRPLYSLQSSANNSQEKATQTRPLLTDWQDKFLQDCLAPEPLVAAAKPEALPHWLKESLPSWRQNQFNQAAQQEQTGSGFQEADLIDLLQEIHGQAPLQTATPIN